MCLHKVFLLPKEESAPVQVQILAAILRSLIESNFVTKVQIGGGVAGGGHLN